MKRRHPALAPVLVLAAALGTAGCLPVSNPEDRVLYLEPAGWRIVQVELQSGWDGPRLYTGKVGAMGQAAPVDTGFDRYRIEGRMLSEHSPGDPGWKTLTFDSSGKIPHGSWPFPYFMRGSAYAMPRSMFVWQAYEGGPLRYWQYFPGATRAASLQGGMMPAPELGPGYLQFDVVGRTSWLFTYIQQTGRALTVFNGPEILPIAGPDCRDPWLHFREGEALRAYAVCESAPGSAPASGPPGRRDFIRYPFDRKTWDTLYSWTGGQAPLPILGNQGERFLHFEEKAEPRTFRVDAGTWVDLGIPGPLPRDSVQERKALADHWYADGCLFYPDASRETLVKACPSPAGVDADTLALPALPGPAVRRASLRLALLPDGTVAVAALLRESLPETRQVRTEAVYSELRNGAWSSTRVESALSSALTGE